MSEWHEVKEEDIEIDGDVVNIHIGTNYQGAIYVEIPIEALKKKGFILTPKEEVGVEEIEWLCDEKLRAFPINEDLLPLKSRGKDYMNLLRTLAKSLLTNYSIRRKG